MKIYGAHAWIYLFNKIWNYGLVQLSILRAFLCTWSYQFKDILECIFTLYRHDEKIKLMDLLSDIRKNVHANMSKGFLSLIDDLVSKYKCALYLPNCYIFII